MVRDKTFRLGLTSAAVLAYTQGHAAAEKYAVKMLVPQLVEPMRFLCNKPKECPDQLVYCSRTTTEPCCFRVENHRVTELLSVVHNLVNK